MYNLLQLPKIQEAQDLHFNVMYDYVCCRLGVCKKESLQYSGLCSERRFGNNNLAKQINYRLAYFLLNHSPLLNEERLKVILKGKPDELVIINEEFEDWIISNGFAGVGIINWNNNVPSRVFIRDNFSNKNSGFLKDIYNELNKVLNYKTFKDWEPLQVYSSYKLAEILGMRACTYCNRDYILVRKDDNGGKMLCPQYDHWFPKSKYPLLQVSFYNLIPSCGSCNSSVKGDTVLNIEDYCHPYMEWENNENFFYTYYLNIPSIDKYKVIVKSDTDNSKLLKTMKELKIDQMYNGHIPELEDLIDLKEAYGDNYLLTLAKSFPKLKTFTTGDVYRMHFGAEKDEVDFYKKPMSKFKKDILKKLKLIDESY